MELISREMALDHIRVLGGEDRERLIGILNNKNILPTIESRPKGEWIDNSEDGYAECPFCRAATNCDGNIEELHYCWNCGAELGADMRREYGKSD